MECIRLYDNFYEILTHLDILGIRNGQGTAVLEEEWGCMEPSPGVCVQETVSDLGVQQMAGLEW